MVHMGWIWLDVTVHTFLGNDTRILYEKIHDWYDRVILYKYMLMYQTVVNTPRIVMTNSHEHVNMVFHESIHALNVWFHIKRVILFCHLIGVNCISYMYPYPMSQVSNLLIYPSVIVSNTIFTIGQALTTYPKPCMYGE